MGRRKTREINVGGLLIGGNSPISIQTMSKTALTAGNYNAIISEMKTLKIMGCDIIRFAIPDESVIPILAEICKEKIVPIVADIHFDYKLALKSLDAGVDKVRINPGNIGAQWKVEEVLTSCKDKNIPIRIGVNGGSLSNKFKELNRVDAMLASATQEIEILEKNGFKNAVFSLKSSDPIETVKVNRLFSKNWDYPLHLGVTEAGPMIPSLVKSSIALSRLLDSGIGDTIRVSISDSPLNEIKAGREILKTTGHLKGGVTIVSCPKCGRAEFDNDNKIICELEEYLYQTKKDITVAVMGCPVNGPGEAKEADIGITGSGNNVIIFKKGKLYKKVKSENIISIIKEEIDKV